MRETSAVDNMPVTSEAPRLASTWSAGPRGEAVLLNLMGHGTMYGYAWHLGERNLIYFVGRKRYANDDPAREHWFGLGAIYSIDLLTTEEVAGIEEEAKKWRERRVEAGDDDLPF